MRINACNLFAIGMILLTNAAKAQTPVHASTASRFSVVPGKVEEVVNRNVAVPPGQPQKRFIRGWISLKEDPIDGDSSKSGGGCLIYLPPDAKSCSVNADCTLEFTLSENGVQAPRVKRNGYCAPEKKCWYKPIPESCEKRSKPDNPLSENFPLSLPLTPLYPTDSSLPISHEMPTYWRVVTCQNLVNKGCAILYDGKAGTNRIRINCRKED